MTTVPHEPSPLVREKPRRFAELLVPELWASLTIMVIWLAVLFAAVYGPDLVSTTPGGSTTTIPPGVAIALFAFLATWQIAKHGFRRAED